MVYRWRCRQCAFGLWAASADDAAEAVRSHLFDHAESNLRRDDLRTVWRCPHCGTQGETYAGDGATESFKSHLFGHVASQLEADAHVADAVGGTGSVLVLAPPDGDAAANARAHFLSRGDAAVVVTADPTARLRLLDRKLPSWPASTTLVTTAAEPLSGVDIDPPTEPEVVTIDGRPDLSGVGETLSRTLRSVEARGSLSVEFDILTELVETFELRTVFRFLHLLSSRLERAGALAHYYLDPRRVQRASINMLEQAFDLVIRADGAVFTSESANRASGTRSRRPS
jgi:rubredoxin